MLLIIVAAGVLVSTSSDNETLTSQSANYDEDVVVLTSQDDDKEEAAQDSSSQEVVEEEPTSQTTPAPEPSTSGMLSVLTLVNKRIAISPLSYSPSNLTSPDVTKRSGAVIDARAAQSLEEMFAAAKDDGHSLMLSNAFRSYTTQQTLYNNYVARDGQAAADTYSARPGHSEHQTGLAADIIVPSGTCSLEACFGDLPEGKWLAENSYKYGFIIRYTKTNKAEAGYTYEPWHIRYIGVSDATAYHESNASSLESYLGKPAAPDYL